MNETKPVYYINGREVNAGHDDLPPILRAPNCELPRHSRHSWRYIASYAGVALAAAAGAVGLLAWIAWRMVTR